MSISICGIKCAECCFFGSQCGGCAAVQGKPFWTVHMPAGVCPLYACCCDQELQHCGLCSEFSCNKYAELRDPGMSDEEHEAGLKARIERVRSLLK